MSKKRVRKVYEPLQICYMDEGIEAGIDEAGRGPMFGRVYAGSVILPRDDEFKHSILKDSKRFSSKRKLLEVYDYIKENAISWSVGYCDEKEIDRMNILNATHTAMHRALNNHKVEPELLLVDGKNFKSYISSNNCVVPYVCIEGGDNLYTAIAGASIIAKVERDKYIEDLCDEYPNLEEFYDLRKNKGYGTKKHMEGLKKYGLTKWHRRSFGICKILPMGSI